MDCAQQRSPHLRQLQDGKPDSSRSGRLQSSSGITGPVVHRSGSRKRSPPHGGRGALVYREAKTHPEDKVVAQKSRLGSLPDSL